MIKSFKKYIKHADIHITCLKYNINNYTINDDLSIDVNDSVFIYKKNLYKIPLNFNKVLKGKGKYEFGDFNVCENKITSLEGSPKEVSGDFICRYNLIESLEYLPKIIGGNIDCRYNNIKYFKGVPESFNGIFRCDGNPIYYVYSLFRKGKGSTDAIYLFAK